MSEPYVHLPILVSLVFLSYYLCSSRPVNFLGGSPLNRLSWLRASSPFINALIDSPSTRWLAFQDGKPLIALRGTDPRLALLTTADVEPFLGSKPYVGQGHQEGRIPAVDLPILDAARFRGAPIVFLGVSEPKGNDYCPTTLPEELASVLVGTPFFSIDVTEASQTKLDHLVQTSTAGTDGYKLSFAEARAATRGLNGFDAGVFAEARSMVDWNFRNKVRRSWRYFLILLSVVPSVLCLLRFTSLLPLGGMETNMYQS